jgi:hypothetical protein
MSRKPSVNIDRPNSADVRANTADVRARTEHQAMKLDLNTEDRKQEHEIPHSAPSVGQSHINSKPHINREPTGEIIKRDTTSSVQTDRTRDVENNVKNTKRKTGKCDQVKAYLVGLTDFAPLKNLCFSLCILHFTLVWMSRLGVLSHIVSAATLKGIHLEQSTYLMSISGFGNLVIRVVSALAMNLSFTNPVIFSIVASLLVSISAFLAAYVDSYTGLSISAALLGMGAGENHLRTHTHAHTHALTHVRTHTPTYLLNKPTYLHTYINRHAPTHAHTLTHKHIHIRT